MGKIKKEEVKRKEGVYGLEVGNHYYRVGTEKKS